MTTYPAEALPEDALAVDPEGIRAMLGRLDRPCHVISGPSGTGLATRLPGTGERLLAAAGAILPEMLGSHAFRRAHGVRHAYMAGAMAAGIASEDLVIALARAGFLSSFGAGGLRPERVRQAVARFETEIGGLGYAVNLLHSPNEPAIEQTVVDLCLAHRARCLEASAFLGLTPALVRYRAAGLVRDGAGRVSATNRVIAKISRPEVARHFLLPAPGSMLADLVAAGAISSEQAELARVVPVADDITVEGDSGGHTDRQQLMAMFPLIRDLRDTVHRERPELAEVRLGAAGGIGTPEAVLAALALGADYVVTGSVNQACVEAGTSERTRRLLATVDPTDVDMAPSADMFEYGAQVQVVKRGSMFAVRARRLYDLYQRLGGLDELSPAEREWLEGQVLRRPVEDVWAETVAFFQQRDPAQIERALNEPKRRMALVFRWYLGLSSRWAVLGDPDRVTDQQIWCGPAMGGFNAWVKGSYLAAPEQRSVTDVALHLLRGAAFGARVNQLRMAGVELPPRSARYRPTPLEMTT
jgi:PfaD family protein